MNWKNHYLWKYRYIYWFQNLRAAEAQQLLFAMLL